MSDAAHQATIPYEGYIAGVKDGFARPSPARWGEIVITDLNNHRPPFIRHTASAIRWGEAMDPASRYAPCGSRAAHRSHRSDA